MSEIMKKQKREQRKKPVSDDIMLSRKIVVFSVRLTADQHEELKRRAREAGHGFVNRIVTEALFG